MAEEETSKPVGRVFGRGTEEERARPEYETEEDMLSTAVVDMTLSGMKKTLIVKEYDKMPFPGSWLVDQSFPDYIYEEKSLSLLRQAVRRNFDLAFSEYEKVEPEWYRSRKLKERVEVNEIAVKQELQNRVCELAKEDKKLQKAGEDPEKAELTQEDIRKIQLYRDFVNEVMIEDDTFTTGLKELEKARKNHTLIKDEDEGENYYKKYIEEILLAAEKLKGSEGEQIESERIRDENKRLVEIISGEKDKVQKGSIQAFVGQTFEDHVYEREHRALLEQAGKRLEQAGLNLTYEGKGIESIEELFEQNPLQTQEIVQDVLAEAELKDKKLREVNDNPKKAGLTKEEVKQISVYRAYREHLRMLDEEKSEGKLLDERMSPKHYATYMSKLRKEHERFFPLLLKALGAENYSPEIIESLEGIRKREQAYVTLLPKHLALETISEQQSNENQRLQEQLKELKAEAEKFQQAYGAIASALKKKLGIEK